MASLEDRARVIRDSMLRQASQEAKAIRDKAEALSREEIEGFEDETLRQMHDKIKNEVAAIRGQQAYKIAQYEIALRQDALKYREELEKLVFASVRGRLLDYLSTPEYKKRLEMQIREKSDQFAGCRVQLREADLGLSEMACDILGPGTVVEADPSIKIGGFKLIDEQNGLFYDGTLDTKLQECKPWFYEHSGLKIS